jgi:pyruvate dehydrogenase (quinone)
VAQAIVDPFEPPMPAKVTLGQTAKFAQPLARGEPNRRRIALTAVSNKVREELV